MALHPVLWHATDMKLSDYADHVGVTYKTAWQGCKAGHLDAYHLQTGTIVVRHVREPQTAQTAASGIALYARLSSAEQQDAAMRQVQRLRTYAAARGYEVVAEVTEIASGLIDAHPNLPNLMRVLIHPTMGMIVVEYRDRLTRVGYGSIATLVAQRGRRVEVLAPSAAGEGLVDDFVANITSVAACISGRRYGRPYGRRTSKRWAEHLRTCVEHVLHSEGEDA